MRTPAATARRSAFFASAKYSRRPTGYQRCDVLVDLGQLDEAFKSYRDSFAINERLATSDRSNSKCSTTSVSHIKVGDVLIATSPNNSPSVMEDDDGRSG
jgi:hypothetical protein